MVHYYGCSAFLSKGILPPPCQNSVLCCATMWSRFLVLIAKTCTAQRKYLGPPQNWEPSGFKWRCLWFMWCWCWLPQDSANWTKCSCLACQWYCKVYALHEMLGKGILFETFSWKLLQECREWWWEFLSPSDPVLSSEALQCWFGDVCLEEEGLCCLPLHSWLQIAGKNSF